MVIKLVVNLRANYMKLFLKILVITIAGAFLLIQLFQIDRNDLPVVPSETLHAAVAVPPDISEILGRSCNDCHSNTTRYPWYAYVQPSAWFLKDHIDHGRSHLNLSVFNTYSIEKKIKRLDEICEEVEAGAMPLPSYLWVHEDAALNENDGPALCRWARTESEKLASQIAGAEDGT